MLKDYGIKEELMHRMGKQPEALRKFSKKSKLAAKDRRKDINLKLGADLERWELELIMRCAKIPTANVIPPEGIRWSLLGGIDEQYHKFSRISLKELAIKRIIKKYPVSNQRYQYLMPDDMERITDWRYGRLKNISPDFNFPRYGENRAFRQFNLLTPASIFCFNVPEEGMKVSYCCQLFRLFQEVFKSHEMDLVWRTTEYLEGKRRGFIQYTNNNIIDLINDCGSMNPGDRLEIRYSSRCAGLVRALLKKFIAQKFNYELILDYTKDKRIIMKRVKRGIQRCLS